MSEHVAQPDNPVDIDDGHGRLCVHSTQIVERFADDLALALHRGSPEVIDKIVGGSHPIDEPRDPVGSAAYLPQERR